MHYLTLHNDNSIGYFHRIKETKLLSGEMKTFQCFLFPLEEKTQFP